MCCSSCPESALFFDGSIYRTSQGFIMNIPHRQFVRPTASWSIRARVHDGRWRPQGGRLYASILPRADEVMDNKRHARDIAAGTVETRNETEIDRVGASREKDWNGCGCSFASQCSRRGQGERLGMMRELVPSANVIGFLINPGNPTSESQIRDVQTAAHASG